MPASAPDFMAPAWASCLRWAIGEERVRADFEKATGHRWTAPRGALDRAIDEATGHGESYVKAFVAWFNENVWGLGDPTEEIEPPKRVAPKPQTGQRSRVYRPSNMSERAWLAVQREIRGLHAKGVGAAAIADKLSIAEGLVMAVVRGQA